MTRKRMSGPANGTADMCRDPDCGGLLRGIDTGSIADGSAYECRACGRWHEFSVTDDGIYVRVGRKPRARKAVRS